MRHLISSALFGLLPIPIGTQTCSDNREDRHYVEEGAQSPEHIKMIAMRELDRLRRELGINIVNRPTRGRARYQVLGRRWGAQRIHLLLNYKDEVDAKARELAAMPGQAPVAVIDTGGCRGVTFYFADGRVCLVARPTRRNQLEEEGVPPEPCRTKSDNFNGTRAAPTTDKRR
jgi:hypothetical protein